MKNMIVRPVVGAVSGGDGCSSESNTPRKAKNVPKTSQGQLSPLPTKTSLGTNERPKPFGFVPNQNPIKTTTKTSTEKKCGPCQKCQSPVFWFSKGGTGPHCIDCEFPSSNLLIRKIAAIAKNQDGSFRIFPIGDFPSLGIPPLPASEQRFEHSPTLDAAGQPGQQTSELGNQLDNQIGNPTDNLIAFHDPDGCLHIRVARFERDQTLQRPDETGEEYEKRMQAGHEIAMHGDTLKNYHQQSQQLPIQKNHIQKK